MEITENLKEAILHYKQGKISKAINFFNNIEVCHKPKIINLFSNYFVSCLILKKALVLILIEQAGIAQW